jgi:hypothetical protein
MANKAQIISQIRFQLEQLSAKNAYHEFEHICRHLARERICSNILPSTGPVSAGGDLGKDFETFLTYLRSSPVSDSTFVGRISEGPIVFACSIQRKALDEKIKSDVKKIVDNGTGAHISSIFFFCTSDISIKKRETQKKWAKQTYSIELEIHDGQSISELLSDREIFWIAQQYLDMPEDIYPRAEEEDKWYDEVLDSWRSGKPIRPNYGDFFEVKSAARYALFEKNIKQDLPFWIDLLKCFINNEFPSKMRLRAIYEAEYITLRGMGTLEGEEKNIKEYFAAINDMDNAEELGAGAALWNCCLGAFVQNKILVTLDEIKAWRTLLFTTVEEKLKLAKTPNQKCPYLELMGYLSLSPDPSSKKIDAKNAIKVWTRLVEIAKDAPLFPLERFSNRLTKYIQFLGNEPEYNYLSQQTDVLLSQRYGDFKAAENCRDRALEWLNLGKKLKAVNQLHTAKIRWFAHETVESSLMSMLLISKSYQDLGLLFAAKYYALAVASIALDSNKTEIKPFVPRAALIAAEQDFIQGSWSSYLDLAEIGLITNEIFGKNSTKPHEVDVFGLTMFHIATMTAIMSVLDSDIHSKLIEKIKALKIQGFIDKLLPKAYAEWKKLGSSEIWARLEEEISGRPFGDFGKVRSAFWSELGIKWAVSWENDYETTAASEQLIAVLQILLADIVTLDLCLMKTDVEIHVSREAVPKFQIMPLASNVGRKWRVILPSHSEKSLSIQDLQSGVLAIAITILNEISLLPQAEFYKTLEEIFRNGISMKVFVAKLYEILYKEFVNEEKFNFMSKAEREIPQRDRDFKIKENAELAWLGNLGPNYNSNGAKQFLKNRYELSMLPIKYTLKNLLRNEKFRDVVKKLRREGWLDWHILNSISNLAATYRTSEELGPNYVDYPERMVAIMKRVEKSTDPPIPVETFSEEEIRLAQKIGMVSTLKVLNLEIRQRTPDFVGIEHFLRNRYNYWTDDIPHEDPFP